MPPVLGQHTVSDPHIESLKVESPGGTQYLQSSPEFALKKLLARQAMAIYSLGQVFRAGEHGRKHRQEFTMLEWYRPGFSLGELECEIADLVRLLAQEFGSRFEAPVTKTYCELFTARFGLNPHRATADELQALLSNEFPDHSRHLLDDGAASKNDFLDALFSLGIEPSLESPTFVRHFPASQAALAKIDNTADGPVALRTELYWRGVELANGYDELQDGQEYRQRINADNAVRRQHGYPVIEADEALLTALDNLPDCVGVALGVDRILMLLLGTNDIAEVSPFN